MKSTYTFAISVKLGMVGADTPLAHYFPDTEDLIITSKEFDEFQDAVDQCSGLCSELVSSFNAVNNESKFKILTEINPSYSNQPTISKDWVPTEVAKVWIVPDIEQTAGQINAISLAQILEVNESGASFQ